ncbi:uncharacterized protein LOC107883048 [Acyrthosiphon pisum]|uniref:Uncharacterized protein n=1 Tax=Acyrthosiphon pisum TaxID=7029 RepID=A0A8R2NT51_ACYPI|nr:uncharacterized protein LOC107883048 [Acyrthosiphon pisum]
MSLEEIKQDPSLWAAYVRGWEDRTADVHLNPSLTNPRTLQQSDEKTDEKTSGCKPDKPKLEPATTSSRIPEPAQRKKPLSTQQMIRKKKRDAARMEEFLAKKRAQQSGPPP